jgi:hypothetical protein
VALDFRPEVFCRTRVRNPGSAASTDDHLIALQTLLIGTNLCGDFCLPTLLFLRVRYLHLR